MSVPNAEPEPTDLLRAIKVYGAALDEVLAAPGSEPPDVFTRAVGKALLARERVGRLLGEDGEKQLPPCPEELEQVALLDRQLKSNAARLVAVVGREKFADWREAVRPAEGAWWWSLEDRAPQRRSNVDTTLSYLSWILIAVVLSFILEIVRRFISGGADLPSTVIQGLLALFAGGTVVQWAKQFVEGGQRGTGTGGLLSTHKARFAAIVILVLIAALMEWARPRVARAYNDWGESLYREGQLTAAIQKYQRATSLEPLHAVAHYNTGNAYEDALDYERAMTEYKSAILADHEFYAPYNNLARLYIVQRSDHSSALKLLDRALSLTIKGEQEVRDLVQSAMYKNRGWANLGLKNYSAAKDDLQQALRLNGEGAEAYCLLAQVLEAQNDKSEVAENWRACLELGAQQKGAIEPSWVGLAQEKLR